ncbi:MAG: hypothetical protein ABFS46_17005 [Myxococcota bacterium]
MTNRLCVTIAILCAGGVPGVAAQGTGHVDLVTTAIRGLVGEYPSLEEVVVTVDDTVLYVPRNDPKVEPQRWSKREATAIASALGGTVARRQDVVVCTEPGQLSSCRFEGTDAHLTVGRPALEDGPASVVVRIMSRGSGRLAFHGVVYEVLLETRGAKLERVPDRRISGNVASWTKRP